MVKMGTKLNSIHLRICFLAWTAWGIGAILVIISSVVFNNDNSCIFNIAHIYNSTLSLLSLIPAEPVVFILTLRNEREDNVPIKTTVKTILLFNTTILFWITYISTFVLLIGGV